MTEKKYIILEENKIGVPLQDGGMIVVNQEEFKEVEGLCMYWDELMEANRYLLIDCSRDTHKKLMAFQHVLSAINEYTEDIENDKEQSGVLPFKDFLTDTVQELSWAKVRLPLLKLSILKKRKKTTTSAFKDNIRNEGSTSKSFKRKKSKGSNPFKDKNKDQINSSSAPGPFKDKGVGNDR